MYVLSAVDLMSFIRDKALKVCSVAFADDSPAYSQGKIRKKNIEMQRMCESKKSKKDEIRRKRGLGVGQEKLKMKL